LREFAAAADTATRTFQARFALPDADEGVIIGMTATVHVRDADAPLVARVPISAVFAEGRGPGVYVVDPASGGLSLTPVTVAGYEGREALLSAGPPEGSQVVAFGVQTLDSGARVRVVDLRR
jgi:multidrug efflux pump subunit AcrA (membrane-fusion protein)